MISGQYIKKQVCGNCEEVQDRKKRGRSCPKWQECRERVFGQSDRKNEQNKTVSRLRESTFTIPVTFEVDPEEIRKKIEECGGTVKINYEFDLDSVKLASDSVKEMLSGLPITFSIDDTLRDRISCELKEALHQDDPSPFEALWYIADCQKECLQVLRKIETILNEMSG